MTLSTGPNPTGASPQKPTSNAPALHPQEAVAMQVQQGVSTVLDVLSGDQLVIAIGKFAAPAERRGDLPRHVLFTLIGRELKDD